MAVEEEEDVEECAPGRLKTSDRFKIKHLSEQGLTNRQVAARVHCSLSSVKRWKYRKDVGGELKERRRIGRPSVSSPADRDRIFHLLHDPPFMSARAVAREFETGDGRHLSERTVRRIAHASGLHCGREVREPPLSEGCMAARLEYAREHMNTRWHAAVFCDEKKVCLSGTPQRCWLLRGERAVHAAPAHPASLNIFASFGHRGTGHIFFFRQNLTAKFLLEILQQHLLPCLGRVNAPYNLQHFLVHDNASTFRNHEGLAALERIPRVEIFHLPPYSPDLNPIENLWAIVQQRVNKRKPTTLGELEQFWSEEWRGVSRTTTENLVNSVPKRLQAVIDANGGFTGH